MTRDDGVRFTRRPFFVAYRLQAYLTRACTLHKTIPSVAAVTTSKVQDVEKKKTLYLFLHERVYVGSNSKLYAYRLSRAVFSFFFFFYNYYYFVYLLVFI